MRNCPSVVKARKEKNHLADILDGGLVGVGEGGGVGALGVGRVQVGLVSGLDRVIDLLGLVVQKKRKSETTSLKNGRRRTLTYTVVDAVATVAVRAMRQRTATAFIVIMCLRRTRRKDYNLTAGFFINE